MMAGRFRSNRIRVLTYARIVSVVAVAAVLVALFGLMMGSSVARPTESRTVQVWPDRTVGVTNGRLEATAAHPEIHALPFGVVSSPSGGVVRGRTYLSFPLQVFPPGTDVMRATLYAFVDSATGPGEAQLGAYRVLQDWDPIRREGPDTWPILLNSPIAVTSVRVSSPSLGSSGGRGPTLFGVRLSGALAQIGAEQGVSSYRPPGHAGPLAQGDTLLRFEPADTEVAIGGSTEVAVRVEDARSIGWAEIVVKYDPEILEVVDADPDIGGVQIELGPFLNPDSAGRNTVSPERGEIELAQEAAGDAVSGSGVLARITFSGKALGTSDIWFADVLLEDDGGQDLPESRERGSVAVVPDASDAATASPAATVTATAAVSPTATSSPSPTATRAETPAAGATATQPSSPLPTPLPFAPSGVSVPVAEFPGTWITWDVTALLRAWLSQDVPNHGLAIASAPYPDAGPDLAGDVLLARWFTSGDPETAPHIVVEYEVLPVTATPTATSAPLLPPAGHANPARVGLIAVLAVAGLVLLGAGLAMKGHREQ